MTHAIPSYSRHGIFSDARLEKVGLALQAQHLHPVERVGRVVHLVAAQGHQQRRKAPHDGVGEAQITMLVGTGQGDVVANVDEQAGGDVGQASRTGQAHQRHQLAGAEAGYPPTRHLDAFHYLQRENSHFTIHAGEAFGLPSIWEAIQWCGADRLGHGVRIVDDIEVSADGAAALGRLAAYVRDRRIPLEMCPSSNVQTGAAASIAEHPIGLLRRLGFRVTVNTDNRLMSGTSMSREFGLLSEAFGYSLDDMQWFTVNAMKSAFIPFDERLEIINDRIKPAYAALRAELAD